MTFLERALRRLGAVTPSSPGRDFRRASAVSRSLDHENVTTDGAGGTRLTGARRASGRFLWDVGGSLSIPGDGALLRGWDQLTQAEKDNPVMTLPLDIVVAEVEDDDGARFDGVTLEHPDGRLMLASLDVRVFRDPGAVPIGAVVSMNPGWRWTQDLTAAEVIPPGTTHYRVAVVARANQPLAPAAALYPGCAIGAVLHFSTNPVAW